MDELRGAVRKESATIPDEEIEAHFDLLPEIHFLGIAPGEIARHLAMIHEFFAVISRAEDRMGLIYELSRALFEREFDITRGRAVTRQGVVSVDFRLQKTNRRKTITVNELRDLMRVLKDIVHGTRRQAQRDAKPCFFSRLPNSGPSLYFRKTGDV